MIAAQTPTPADATPAPTPATAIPATATPATPATATPATATPATATPAGSAGTTPATPAAASATPASGGTASSEHGWIDAEGNVYVRTAAGDRAIGSWQAGTAEEGLHHFQRRYDDLVTEVELLEARLSGGMSDASHTKSSAARLRESLADAHVIGNLDALATRLDALIEQSSAKADEQKAAKAKAREEATTRKQALVAEAEDIANNSTQWKVAGDRLRDILTEWKTIRGVDRKTDTELWRRYAAARDGFSRRRGSHFAGLDQQRKQVQGIKEQLVTEAESLAESTDWQATANRLKQLMNDWKAAGRAPREAEEQLWKRFRAAQDTFFAHRSATFSERDAELKSNQTQKEALLAEAERIDPDSDLKGAQAAMRDVQARWDEIGRVPREAVAQLDRRLRAVEERVRVAADAEWRRGSVESNPLLAQMREQVAKAERQLERAKTQGDQRRIAEAEKALASKRQFLDLAEQAG
ncbi:DUF349 domain-containing protein [Cryptosporangium japonicum]|uniref:DUF349 domain-containing protein n=1 Tax=Cryptosporangium japonicum TaxID=80872 RepID=A0ABP3EIF0_9ACTN